MQVSTRDRPLRLGDTVRYSDGLITVDWKLAGVQHQQLEHTDRPYQHSFWFTTDDLEPEFAEMRIERQATLVKWLRQDEVSLLIEADITNDE